MHSDSLWNYSCRVYQRESVSGACLRLQNTHGQDVNLLLFAAWHGHRRGLLAQPTLQQALSFSQAWAQGVVQPLRQARTWLKQEGQHRCASTATEREALLAIREHIKLQELRTERYQQDHLEALVQTPEHCLSAAARHAAMQGNLLTVALAFAPHSPALQDELQELFNGLCEPLPSA